MNKFIQKIKEDFPFYAEKFLRIENKTGSIIPFKLNNAQRKVHSIIENFKRENPTKPIRTLNLKARQEGISTYYTGRNYWKVSMNFNKHAKIVGHVAKASNNLFNMTKRYYDYLPNELKPVLKSSNAQELSFAKLQSDIQILTAETGDIGRSGTNQYLHLTELAFWRDAKTTLTALMQTVPDDAGTEIHIETTANGLGGEFYELWKDAKAGKNDFIPIFLAWWEHEEYTKPIEDVGTFVLTAEELTIKETYNLTNEQLNWRRWAIKNKCGGDEDVFKQEYPANDTEAFLTSGRPVFDVKVCELSYRDAEKAQFKIGNFEYEKDGTVKFYENKSGYVKLFYEPELIPNEINRFVAGTDVAEGLEQGDYSVISVLDRKFMNVFCSWHGHIDPDLLAEEQKKISVYLKGDITFCTEINNHGITVVNQATKLNLNQYFRENFTKGFEEPKMKEYGFKTTSSEGGTRKIMLDRLTTAIREREFNDDDVEFWGECLTFVKDEKGRMSAQGKNKNPGVRCYDDRVFSRGLMYHCHIWLPSMTVKTENFIKNNSFTTYARI